VAIASATPAAAQGWNLAITAGAPVAFPTPTEANYDAGFVDANAALAFTVSATSGFSYRNAEVSIRSSSATMGGSKPIGDLQWRRSDVATWTPMTTVNAPVQDNNMINGFISDPWSNTILLRTNLSWANDGPGTYNPTLVVTLTISAP
jgi:hypothetical protein